MNGRKRIQIFFLHRIFFSAVHTCTIVLCFFRLPFFLLSNSSLFNFQQVIQSHIHIDGYYKQYIRLHNLDKSMSYIGFIAFIFLSLGVQLKHVKTEHTCLKQLKSISINLRVVIQQRGDFTTDCGQCGAPVTAWSLLIRITGSTDKAGWMELDILVAFLLCYLSDINTICNRYSLYLLKNYHQLGTNLRVTF